MIDDEDVGWPAAPSETNRKPFRAVLGSAPLTTDSSTRRVLPWPVSSLMVNHNVCTSVQRLSGLEGSKAWFCFATF
jgi:hypothetical protein